MLVFNPVSNLLAFLIHSRFKFFFKKLEPRILYTILVVSIFHPTPRSQAESWERGGNNYKDYI